MQKLPQRFTSFAFAFYMAAMMGCLMCFTVVAVQTGVSSDYLGKVLQTYIRAVPIAFVSILVVKPLVMRLVSLSVEQPGFVKRFPSRFTPLVFSLYMAALMNLLMCCAIVAFQAGFGDSYWHSVLKAYIIGMPIAFCSVVIVRPIALKLVSKTVQPHG